MKLALNSIVVNASPSAIAGKVALKITSCLESASARLVGCGPSMPASRPVTARRSGAEAPVDNDLDQRRAAGRDCLANRAADVVGVLDPLRRHVERASEREEVH